MNHLPEHIYIKVHRSCPDTDTVKHILWAHPTSIELLHAFPCVLMMDCTYCCTTDPFQLVLSILIISLSYIYAMDIQYPHWHIRKNSIVQYKKTFDTKEKVDLFFFG